MVTIDPRDNSDTPLPYQGRTFAEILAPIHEDFRKSGMTEGELDAILENALSESRAARKQRGDAGRGSRRFRFTLRALMALPVLITIGFFLADRIYGEEWKAAGTELVEFRVLDKSTGRPVAGTAVELTGGPAPLKGSTGPEGIFAFAVPYRFRGSETLLRKTRYGGFPWTASLSAGGYQRTTTRLDDHRPGSGFDFITTQPIVIRLRPLTPH